MSRNPRLAEDVEHSYGNKYDLADFVTNAAIIAILNVLEDELGLTKEVLQSIDKSKSTTLRFQAESSCEFVKEESVAWDHRDTQKKSQKQLETSREQQRSHRFPRWSIMSSHTTGSWELVGKSVCFLGQMWRRNRL